MKEIEHELSFTAEFQCLSENVSVDVWKDGELIWLESESTKQSVPIPLSTLKSIIWMIERCEESIGVEMDRIEKKGLTTPKS